MKRVDPKLLEVSSVVFPKALTKAEMIETVIAAFKENGNRQFSTMKNVEGTDPAALRETSVANNALGFVVSTLQAHRVPINQTAGSVMQVLGIGQEQLHDLVCFCLEQSDFVAGSTMAARFTSLQDGTLAGYRESMMYI